MADLVAQAELVHNRAERIEGAAWNGDATALLGQIGALSTELSDLATDAVLEAIRQGATVKHCAALLGVPVSTLRGARQEALAHD